MFINKLIFGLKYLPNVLWLYSFLTNQNETAITMNEVVILTTGGTIDKEYPRIRTNICTNKLAFVKVREKNVWPIFDRFLTNFWLIFYQFLTDFWPIFDWFFTNFWPIFVQFLTDFLPIFDRFLTNFCTQNLAVFKYKFCVWFIVLNPSKEQLADTLLNLEIFQQLKES